MTSQWWEGRFLAKLLKFGIGLTDPVTMVQLPSVGSDVPWAASVGPRALPMRGAEQRMALVADMAQIVPWEVVLPDGEVFWGASVAELVGGMVPRGNYWLSTAPGRGADPMVRPVDEHQLGDALLAPVLAGVRAGLLMERCEVTQHVVSPDGRSQQVVIRAIQTSDAATRRLVGVVRCQDVVEEPGPAEHVEEKTVPTAWVEADAAERLRILVDNSPDGVVVHQDGLVVFANREAANMVGYDTVEAGIGASVLSFIHEDYVHDVVGRLMQLQNPGDVAKGHEIELVRADGTRRPVEIVSARIMWSGRPAYQVILHDISERHAAEAARRAQQAIERRYAAAVAVLEEGVVVFDRSGAVLAANGSAGRILGKRLYRGIGDTVITGTGPVFASDERILRVEELPVHRALDHRTTRSHVILGVVGEEGRRQWLSVSTRILSEDQAADGAMVVCSVSDITERKQLMDRLAWEARNDSLTGLLNRTGLLSRIEVLMGDEDLVSGTVVVVVDIDRFKMVNDSMGHAVGDEVLRAIAHRLGEAVPPTASAGRLHGDGFAVVITGITDVEGALGWAETIRAATTRPLRLASGKILNLGASVGVVRANPNERDGARLLQDADLAMLAAKARYRGRVALFDSGLRDEIGGRLELEHDLRAAVANGELRIEYQPVGAMADGRTLGLEALVRWEHPVRGLLMPARFIALAEESELIVKLGSWILTQSLAQMARWRARYPGADDAFIAVNVSPRQLEGTDLVPAVEEALRRSGLPPSAVVLEITESGFVAEDPHVAQVLDQLRGAGVRLAVDDFGAGYSSLGQLKRLPVSFLKIDRAFIEGLGQDPQDDHIVSIVTELGHGLGLQVIAEGIEEERQRAAAFRLGCDFYQGYLLARPTAGRNVPRFWGSTPA